MEKYLIDFAKNLKMLRDEKGISLRNLAAELGISKSALHQYENCLNDPSLSVVKKIADYFDEDINWLIGESNQRRIKKIAQ